MPGSVKVRVLSARNLPIMDRSTLSTDAFVEICIGSTTYKTDVIRRSLNPSWNSDWFYFELDDRALQEEVLLLNAHDTIGRVYFDLNPLLSRGQSRSLRIRGEISLTIRVDVFLDTSRYHQSSIGVRFFYSCGVPNGYTIDFLIGFIQELVMNDDPEHQWIEKIRTSRASNEARQRLFSRLSGELQRKMGVKVLNLGGNSVIGYQLHFDLEGETGVVVRGIGTAVRLHKLIPTRSPPTSPVSTASKTYGSAEVKTGPSIEFSESPTLVEWELPTKGPAIAGNIEETLGLGEFPFLTISQPIPGMIRHFGSIVAAKSVNLMDKNTPAGIQFRDAWWLELRTEIVQHMHSLHCTAVMGYREECTIYEDVCILSNYGTAVVLDGQFVRPFDRSSVRGTMRPVGTQDLAAECDLEVEETTAVDSVTPIRSFPFSAVSPCSSESRTKPKVFPPYLPLDTTHLKSSGALHSSHSKQQPRIVPSSNCSLCHMPRQSDAVPQMSLLEPTSSSLCEICKAAFVPGLLLSSIDFPLDFPVTGRPSLIQARICRTKKELKNEMAANELSELLPFMEYELHYRLMQKLRLRGMNALFGLRFSITVGECFIAAIATGTGVFASALPSPPLPRVYSLNLSNASSEDLLRARLRKRVKDYVQKSRQMFCLADVHVRRRSKSVESGQSTVDDVEFVLGTGTWKLLDKPPATAGISEDLVSTEPQEPTYGTVFLETAEPEPEELTSLLNDPLPPSGLLLTTTESIPNCRLDADLHSDLIDLNKTIVVGCSSFASAHPTSDGVMTLSHTESNWIPIHSFTRLHEEKLTLPDSFIESTGFLPAAVLSTQHTDSRHVISTGDSISAGSKRGTSSQLSGSALTTSSPNLHMISTRHGSSVSVTQLGNLHNWHHMSASRARVEQVANDHSGLGHRLSDVLRDFNQLTWFRFRHLLPCALTALDFRLILTDDDHVQILATGMVSVLATSSSAPGSGHVRLPSSTSLAKAIHEPSTIYDHNENIDNVTGTPNKHSPPSHSPPWEPGDLSGCLLTPLSSVANTCVDAYLGNLDFFFIRETNDLREAGGICGFLHSSLAEVQAVVGAHTSSLGGNALLSYHLSEVLVLRPPSRNQAQCLLNVCGDMAKISYIKSV
ncbi:hypothetical protein P879_02233 [Paragonimus westermani]|uniref:C2 domain-containing protein n=1 Tax=Paragonimus westermani TaxID=34504 RepID=A0A8T0D0E2_9TREM|nr:hypothetical protein P879_02233 [Paragonimus westermani]